MKTNVLRGEIVANGFTLQEVANRIGLSRNTMTSRMRGQSPFNAEEIIRLCDVLHIDDPAKKCDIFLDNSSHK